MSRLGVYLGKWSRDSFSLDLRSLALVRILLALLLLADLAVRATALEAHYGESGLYPVSDLYQVGFPAVISLFALSGETWYLAFVFLLNALVLLALLLGWKTKWATLLSWLFLLSLHNRNNTILNGGDTWLRLTLFWAMFVPWARYWSLDSSVSLKDETEEETSCFGVSSLAFVGQVFLVYLFAGLYKTGSSWWTDASAVKLTMMANEWSGEWAYYLLYYPGFMEWLTRSVFWLELFGPWLLFTPIAFGPVRTFLVCSFFSFHFGLYLFMELGFFPVVGMVCVLSLLPTWFWERKPIRKMTDSIAGVWGGLYKGEGATKTRESFTLPLWQQLFVSLSFLAVLLSNLERATEKEVLPEFLQAYSRALRLDQYWGLFAPDAPQNHSWFLAVASLRDGSKIDLLRGGQVLDWSAPSSSKIYGNQRTKRYLVTISGRNWGFLRPHLARYYYRSWTERLPDLERVEVYRLYRKSTYVNEAPQKQLLSSFPLEEQ